jgi:ribosomal protein S18 acetylase RimI-like enzyme
LSFKIFVSQTSLLNSTGKINMGEIIIRKAAENDFASIIEMPVKLAAHLEKKYDPTIKEDWFLGNDAKEFYFEFLSNKQKCFFVAEEENKIIGFVVGELVDKTYYWYRKINCFASLDEIFVDEAYRSKGVGTKLMTQFKNWCKEQGADRISVEVSTANIPAALFYQKHAFKDQYLIMETELTNDASINAGQETPLKTAAAQINKA